MKVNSRDRQRYLEHWQEEVDSAAQYHALAESEPQEKLAQVYENLARVEERHIAFWEEQLQKAGEAPPQMRTPSWRSRVLIFIAKRFSPQLIVPTIAASETFSRNNYLTQKETAKTKMAAQERWHAKVLRQISRNQTGGIGGGSLGRLEGRHHSVGGNALRAAVLGANDGLCSNLSLVMGVAGAAVNNRGILVTGFAGLLAGAFSMALGEWISVTSSRELAEKEIKIESEELAADPKGEGEELKLIYEAKGFSPADAQAMATRLLSDDSIALDTLVREELGVDPQNLGGSAWEAAGFSFALFAIGAIIPVLPFLFTTGKAAIVFSLLLSTMAFFGIGTLITIFTGRRVLFSAGRQLFFGLAAAGITFGIGRLIGTVI